MIDSTSVNGNSASPIVRAAIDVDRQTLEEQIETGLRKAEEGQRAVAEALAKIRDEKLYKPEFKSFGAYIDAKYGKSRQWAHNLIQHLGVLENVNHGLQNGTVTQEAQIEPTERQSRELAKVPATFRGAVWKRAVEIASEEGRDKPEQADVELAVLPYSVKLIPSDGHATIISDSGDLLNGLLIEPCEQAGFYITTRFAQDAIEGDRRGVSAAYLGLAIGQHKAERLLSDNDWREIPCEPQSYNRWLYDSAEESREARQGVAA